VVERKMGEPAAALSIELPEKSADLTQWAAETARRLDAATRCPPETLPQVLSAETCCQLLERCQKVLHLEPTLLEVSRTSQLPLAAIVAGGLLHCCSLSQLLLCRTGSASTHAPHACLGSMSCFCKASSWLSVVAVLCRR
jgi:hypothetical protein